ncbi:unnamed protein product [Urochloa humidicola]
MARMVILVAMLAVLLAASSSSADAREFHVGGRGGWAPNPAEPFNTWAERNRFQVNDTLVFRYNKDADGVVVVTPSHYDACNTTEPVLRLAGGGESRFVFAASGPYFFVSADAARCKAGERLIVVVLAVRGGNTPSSPTLSPPKSSSSPPTSPPPSAATPAPTAVPSPPNSPSSPASPPPVDTPAPHALPPPPPAGKKNATSPAPAPAPAPAGTNVTPAPPSPSSAAALRGNVLACLLIIGSAILV